MDSNPRPSGHTAKGDLKIYPCKDLPGEVVQMDTIKIAPGIYQYTAVDDFSRFMMAELYPRRTASDTLQFLELVLDSFAMPVQGIQTDRGGESMALSVQRRLQELCIKFRPTRPAAPHLNGKVERAQRTVLKGLYSNLDVDRADLAEELAVWLIHYNYQRLHGSLGVSPIEKMCERTD